MAQKTKAKRKVIEQMLQDLRRDPVSIDVRVEGDSRIFDPMIAAFVRAYELPDRIVVLAAAPSRITPMDAKPVYNTHVRSFMVLSAKADDYGWRVETPEGEAFFSRVFPGESRRSDEIVAEFASIPKGIGAAHVRITDEIEGERATELTP